ncbi:MAG: carboxypeptidase-like regulatory domain-containing protein, partial [Flavobacteriales bacterium]|nr:carboxypeptidase-like regulatory domain-containing protein [Flavobacteriales bacterium]
MKLIIYPLFILMALVSTLNAQAQESAALTSVVRGTVIDQQSQYPIIGAAVVIVGTDPIQGAVTDLDGRFRIEGVKVGRISLQATYLGYEPMVLSGLLLNSGKELEINIQLIESLTELQTVEVTAKEDMSNSLNEMSTVSTRTLSMEEARRFSGTLQDVARMAQNYAGVGTTSDDRNDIV